MLRYLAKLILAWGKYSTEKYEDKGDYKPAYGGKWVNKSKAKYGEDWQWEEPRSKVVNLRKYWVNVFKQGKDSYMIVVAMEPSEFALEYVDCESANDAYRAIKIFEAYYKVLGQVQTDEGLLSQIASESC